MLNLRALSPQREKASSVISYGRTKIELISRLLGNGITFRKLRAICFGHACTQACLPSGIASCLLSVDTSRAWMRAVTRNKRDRIQ